MSLAAASTLHMPFKDETFGFVNDRGCFHVFEPEYRKAFAEEVRRAGDLGYRISRQEITSTFSALFEILRINDIQLRGKTGSHKGARWEFQSLLSQTGLRNAVGLLPNL